jgi:hypothetical protein
LALVARNIRLAAQGIRLAVPGIHLVVPSMGLAAPGTGLVAPGASVGRSGVWEFAARCEAVQLKRTGVRTGAAQIIMVIEDLVIEDLVIEDLVIEDLAEVQVLRHVRSSAPCLQSGSLS